MNGLDLLESHAADVAELAGGSIPVMVDRT